MIALSIQLESVLLCRPFHSPWAASSSGVAKIRLFLLKNCHKPCSVSTSTSLFLALSKTGSGRSFLSTENTCRLRGPVRLKADTPRFLFLSPRERCADVLKFTWLGLDCRGNFTKLCMKYAATERQVEDRGLRDAEWHWGLIITFCGIAKETFLGDVHKKILYMRNCYGKRFLSRASIFTLGTSLAPDLASTAG